MKPKVILIVEDEAAIRDMLRFVLAPAGFTVAEADTVKQAELRIAELPPDLILLDWMLPGMSGIDFTKQLKRDAQTKHIPIIMLTARAEEESKIKGLEVGADDYVTKPFSPRELIARINTVLRRGLLVEPEGTISFHDLRLNTHTHQVKIKHEILELTPIEYKLLLFFLKHQDRVYSREQLLTRVWGNESDIDERTVDVQIRRLRTRLKPYHYDSYLKTRHGAGYQFSGDKS